MSTELHEAAALCEAAATLLGRASALIRSTPKEVINVHDDSPGTTRRGLNYYVCGVQKDTQRMGEWIQDYLGENTYCGHGFPPGLNGPNGICGGCDNARAHAARRAEQAAKDVTPNA